MSKAERHLYEQEYLFQQAHGNLVLQEHIAKKLREDLKNQRHITTFFLITMWFIAVTLPLFTVIMTAAWGIIALMVTVPALVLFTPPIVVGFAYTLPKVRQREANMEAAIARMDSHLQTVRQWHASQAGTPKNTSTPQESPITYTI